MIIGIFIDKVQKFIYQRIDDVNSNSLTDAKTLRNIMRSSEKVKKVLREHIESFFGKDYIVNVSGKVILRVSGEEDEVKQKLQEFFKEVYYFYDGGIFPIYVCFPESDFEKFDAGKKELEIIKRMESEWKNVHAKDRVIEENKDYIFNFLLQPPSTDHFTKISHVSKDEDELAAKGVFAKTMSDLADLFGDERRKIAIVKADLDNMGRLFQEISSYTEYTSLSRMLTRVFSLEKLAEVIKNKFPELQGELLPFYIAGDDIFFAVKIEKLFLSIQMLNKILMMANKEAIEIKSNQSPEIDPEKQIADSEIESILKMSVGVCFTDSHLPIRYYHAEVEKQLGIAKKRMKLEEKIILEKPDDEEYDDEFPVCPTRKPKIKEMSKRLGVSISDLMFVSFDGEDGKGESDGLNRFMNEILELQKLRERGVITSSFLHSLIDILDKENDGFKQMRLFLYYAFPEVNNVNDSRTLPALLFKLYLFQLIDKEKLPKDKDRLIDKEKRFKDDWLQNGEEIKKVFDEVLIPTLKVVLLLTHEKYKQNGGKIKKEYIQKKENIAMIKSKLFSRPLSYIFKSREDNELFKLFVQEGELVQGEKHKRYGYKKAPFNTSFFYRVKSLIQQKKNDHVITLFNNYVNHILKVNEDDKKQESKYRLKFDNQSILKLQTALEGLSDQSKIDLFDDLIIFYQYSEARTLYLSMFEEGGDTKNVQKKQ